MVRSVSLNKFNNPDYTLSGERRAKVKLRSLKTLWFNTGTLCNIECKNCYIKSSPTNDDLVYIKVAEVQNFINEISSMNFQNSYNFIDESQKLQVRRLNGDLATEGEF